MGRPRRVWSLTVRSIAVIAGVVLLLGSIASVTRLSTTVLAPILGPERIEQPQAGFAVSFPRDWEYADATVYDADWWDPTHGAPTQQHEEFLDRGGVLRARKRAMTEAGHEQCSLQVLSSVEAQQFVNTVDDDPRVVALETQRLELPGGSAIASDVLDEDGMVWRIYLVTDGDRWVLLECGSDEPPEDDWLSIAETLEFLPTEE